MITTSALFAGLTFTVSLKDVPGQAAETGALSQRSAKIRDKTSPNRAYLNVLKTNVTITILKAGSAYVQSPCGVCV